MIRIGAEIITEEQIRSFDKKEILTKAIRSLETGESVGICKAIACAILDLSGNRWKYNYAELTNGWSFLFSDMLFPKMMEYAVMHYGNPSNTWWWSVIRGNTYRIATLKYYISQLP